MAKKETKPAVNDEVEVIVPDEETKGKDKKESKSDTKTKETNTKNKKSNKKERKSLKKRVSEVISELKKVSKPTFGKVVKNTCVVIAVVAICTLLLFGVDKLFSLVYDLLLP